jgi:hypothetical protein
MHQSLFQHRGGLHSYVYQGILRLYSLPLTVQDGTVASPMRWGVATADSLVQEKIPSV